MNKRFLSLICLILCVSMLASCNIASTSDNGTTDNTTESTTEPDTSESETNNGSVVAERFDYIGSDLTQYISLDKSLYEKIDVTLPSQYLVNDEQIDTYIAQLQFKNKYAVSDGERVTDKAIEYGDSAFIYYTGYYNGEAFEGGSNASDSEPTELGIGSGKFIEGFEDGLIGVVPAETSKENPVSLNLKFPENYGNDMAGKEVVFKVWVEYIVEYGIPEYNEDFVINIAKFEAEGEDIIAEYEEYVKGVLEAEISGYREQATEDAMWSYLIEKSEIGAYPEGEVEFYYNSYIEQYEYYMQMYSYMGYSFKDLGDFVSQYLGLPAGSDWEAIIRSDSENCVKQNLIFQTIAKLENVIVTATDYNDAINYFVEYYGQNGATYTAKEIEESLGADYIKEYVIFTKVAKLLRERTTVSYE